MFFILVLCSSNVVWLPHTLRGHALYDCVTDVYSREIINMFLVGQVSGLVENLNIRIFLHAINVINLKLCVMVLLIELYLFIPPSVTLNVFQVSRAQQCQQL